MYNSALGALGEANIDWVDDTIHVSLHTSSYAPNIDTHDFYDDVTNEVSPSGSYVAGGLALSGKTVSIDTTNNRAEFQASNVVITGFTGVFRYLVVRKFNATASLSRLICYLDLGSDVTVTNSTYTITWNADGVFYIKNRE